MNTQGLGQQPMNVQGLAHLIVSTMLVHVFVSMQADIASKFPAWRDTALIKLFEAFVLTAHAVKESPLFNVMDQTVSPQKKC